MSEGVIYQDEDVTVFRRSGSSSFTLVTFGDLTTRPVHGPFWGFVPIDRLDLDAIGIVAHSEHWYPLQAMERCLAAIKQHAKDFRIGYGNSMGGYAALKYGKALGLARVLAVAPQTTINPAETDRDTRYGSFFVPERHARMRIGAEDLADWVAVVADPYYVEDQEQVSLLPPDPRINFVLAPFTKHWTITLLAGTQVLKEATRCVELADARGLRHLIRSERKSSAIYNRLAGVAALDLGHLALGNELISRSEKSDTKLDFLGTSAQQDQVVTLLSRVTRLRDSDPAQAAAAEIAFKQCLPSDPDRLVWLSESLLSQYPDFVERLWKAKLAEDEKNGAAWFHLSRAVATKSPVKEAIPFAERAEAFLQDSTSRLWLAHLYSISGEIVGAEKGYRSALSLDPLNGRAWLGLSKVVALRDPRQAMDHAIRAAELLDGDREALACLGEVYLASRKLGCVPVPDYSAPHEQLRQSLASRVEDLELQRARYIAQHPREQAELRARLFDCNVIEGEFLQEWKHRLSEMDEAHSPTLLNRRA